ncbi:MAG: hypothetical protein Q8P26_04490 [Candidatus Levybacteria bacterium]|nr:hypothetical protein [Candidatus Levybacteria bacterium]
MKELCLQQKIGSCSGCPIQEMAIEKMRQKSTDEKPAVVRRISNQLCPEGIIMQMPKLQKQSIM